MKADELKELFLVEAIEQQDELDKLFTELEKNHRHQGAIEAIFRLTHNLKANAASLELRGIHEVAHRLEDIFNEIRADHGVLNEVIFNDLFRANDKLRELIHAAKEEKTVSYLGLSTRLGVILREIQGKNALDLTEEPQPTPVPIPQETPPRETNPHSFQLSDAVQIPIKKLDHLLNMVGELAIERDRMILMSSEGQAIAKNDFAALQRIISELQHSVMNIRLIKVSVLFQKFHRVIRDIAQQEQKEVNLELEGTETEIDRNVLQIISDSLIHLVRNAVSHGIEPADERTRLGKPSQGKITLRAKNEKNAVILEVSDDGRGIEVERIRRKIIERELLRPAQAQQLSAQEIVRYIFMPGFSSADQVSEISGRGVGMDVVKGALDSIGGKIYTHTQAQQGTRFTLTLPASVAVKPALLFLLENIEFALPLVYSEAVITVSASEVHHVGSGLIITHQKQTIPLVFLRDIFGLSEEGQSSPYLPKTQEPRAELPPLHIIIASDGERSVALVIDHLLRQQEIVEKPLKKPLDKLEFINGASILGNGNVCLVLDVPAISQYVFDAVQVLT